MVKKNNQLDKIKKSKYSKMSIQDKYKQEKYYSNFMKEVLRRKKLGDEKYGNYIFEVDKKIAYKEFEEEVQDAVAHLIALCFRFKFNKELK
jgi:predicted S18 family serine protease